MRTRGVTLVLIWCAGAASATQMSDRLAERATRSEAAAAGRPAPLALIPPGVELFHLDGLDNAATLRPVPDVTGDGIEEVLAGIEDSGVPNVFLLDGASSGAATVLWSVQTNGGASGGSPYGDSCLTVGADADGNGAPSILVGTAWGGRTAYQFDGLDGSEDWRFDTYLNPPASGWVYSVSELSDQDGDSIPEVALAAGSDADSVYAVDGASSGAAALLWRWQAADGVVSTASPGDLDGDGDHDVVVAVGDLGRAIVALDGSPPTAAGSVLWSYSTGDRSARGVAVADDVTGDGIAELLAVVWALDGSSIRCLAGATGALVWASTTVAEYGMLADRLADVTGDGVADVIVASWENAAQVLDGATGARVWKRTVGTLNGGDVWTARRVGDLNGDGFDDVVAGSFDGHVYALSGINGYPFWAFQVGRRLFAVHGLGDLNGDGVPEVGAGSQNLPDTALPVIQILDGDAGLLLPLFADDFENGAPVGWSAQVTALAR